MRSSSTSRSVNLGLGVVCALGALGVLGACGLEVTQDRPTYEDLDPPEKNVVQIVLSELRGFNKQVEARTKYSIATIIDKEKIDVSFEGKIFFGNLGDQVIHLSTWENLEAGQRALVAQWFKKTEAAAKPLYEAFFYRFLAISQGAKQYQYEVLGVDWMFANRSLYNIERDSLRETLSYYKTVGKEATMWGLATTICKPLLAQYGASLPFDKKYLASHLQELANPTDPTGYMVYVCRWIDMGKEDSVDLTTELTWVPTIPSLQDKEKQPGGA